MNKATRDADRAAIVAAYNLRIASGEHDLRAGFTAWTLFIAVHAVCVWIIGFMPIGLLHVFELYVGPLTTLETMVSVLAFGGLLYYVVRVLIPVGFDVVWRMDILSNKMGYVRPSDVSRLFSLWSGLEGNKLPLLRRLSGDA